MQGRERVDQIMLVFAKLEIGFARQQADHRQQAGQTDAIQQPAHQQSGQDRDLAPQAMLLQDAKGILKGGVGRVVAAWHDQICWGKRARVDSTASLNVKSGDSPRDGSPQALIMRKYCGKTAQCQALSCGSSQLSVSFWPRVLGLRSLE